MIKFSFPVFEMLTICVGVEPIGISPKLTVLVTRLYLGPRMVTLPLVELTPRDSPFKSERTTLSMDRL